MALNRNTQQLNERIAALRLELEAFIDAKAETVKAQTPGVPLTVIRGLITARAGNCECRQYLQIKEQDDAAEKLAAEQKEQEGAAA